MHPKLKKFDLLKTGTPAEKDLVKYITASMLEKLGEEKTVKIFSALSEVGIKLVDFSNALSSRGPGLSMPKLKWLTDKDGHTKPDFRHLEASTEPTEEYPGESLIDLDMVRDYLAGRYGREMAVKKLDKMTRGQLLDIYEGLVTGKDVSEICDAIHVQQTTVPDPPRMSWRTDSKGRKVPDYSHLSDGPPEVDHVKTVLTHLTKKHGETKAKAKIRAMSGLELVKLSHRIRRNQESMGTETGKVDLGGGRQIFPAPRIDWSKKRRV